MEQAQFSGAAVITGASSGIGAVYADRLAARGHDLVLVARRRDRLESLAMTLEDKHGATSRIVVADLADPTDLAGVESLLAEDDDIEVLVNNAGAGGLGGAAEVGVEVWERVVKLNMLAPARLSHAALRGFRRRNRGGLINIGSVVAFAPGAVGAIYTGSKAFVLNFTRSLQAEYAATPLRIQLVQPGPVRSEFFGVAGVSADIFPATSFLTAEQLVDAALTGFDQGEAVSTPSLLDLDAWRALESAREGFMAGVGSGRVAGRYAPRPAAEAHR